MPGILCIQRIKEFEKAESLLVVQAGCVFGLPSDCRPGIEEEGTASRTWVLESWGQRMGEKWRILGLREC